MSEKLTLELLLEGIKSCESYHKLHEFILHKLGQTTGTDEAIHTRNIYRASQMRDDASKMKFIPYKFEGSRIEDEYAEWRHLEKKDGG